MRGLIEVSEVISYKLSHYPALHKIFTHITNKLTELIPWAYAQPLCFLPSSVLKHISFTPVQTYKQDNGFSVTPCVPVLWNTSTHWTQVFQRYLCDSHLVLVLLPPFSSCHPLIICFSFSFCHYFHYPISISVCHFASFSSSSFQNIIGKDVREQLLLSQDKTLITLPMLGKPPWLDSCEVYRNHTSSIFLKHIGHTQTDI